MCRVSGSWILCREDWWISYSRVLQVIIILVRDEWGRGKSGQPASQCISHFSWRTPALRTHLRLFLEHTCYISVFFLPITICNTLFFTTEATLYVQDLDCTNISKTKPKKNSVSSEIFIVSHRFLTPSGRF